MSASSLSVLYNNGLMTISSDFVAKKCGFAGIVEYVLWESDRNYWPLTLTSSLRRVAGNKQVLPPGDVLVTHYWISISFSPRGSTGQMSSATGWYV